MTRQTSTTRYHGDPAAEGMAAAKQDAYEARVAAQVKAGQLYYVDGDPMLIESIAYHRNGICGEGFHAVTFTWQNRPMVGIVFGADEDDFNPRVAVLDRKLTGEGEVGFGINSWRGDHFADGLKAAIRASREN